ncbi:MAG: hypothetical protein ACRD29_07475 [Acidimicrobiales bacterium]
MPVFAALNPDDLGFRLLFLGHIMFVVGGFGARFVNPMLAREIERGGPAAGAAAGVLVAAAQRLSTPAIWLSGLFGIVLVAVGGFDFGDLWINLAMVLFLVAAVLATFLYLPNVRRLAALTATLSAPVGEGEGPPPATAEIEARLKRGAMYGGILDLLFVLLLIDMIWKPGL